MLYKDSGFPHVAFSQSGFVKSSLVATATELLTPKMSLLEGGGGMGFSSSAASTVEAPAAATLQYKVSIVLVRSKSLLFCSCFFPINLQSNYDAWEGDGLDTGLIL